MIRPATQMSRRTRWLWIWCVIFASVLAVYLLAPIILCWVGEWLDVGERLDTPVDYAYVLGGEANTRPFLAAAIYRSGYTQMVLIPEGNPVAKGEDETSLSEHKLQRTVLLKRGVPAQSITQLPGPVDSTEDEARALATFLRSSPRSSVAVVTNNFHTRRARIIFRRHLSQHQGRVYFVACPTDGFGPQDWWHYKDGILWYVAEYAKLAREHLR